MALKKKTEQPKNKTTATSKPSAKVSKAKQRASEKLNPVGRGGRDLTPERKAMLRATLKEKRAEWVDAPIDGGVESYEDIDELISKVRAYKIPKSQSVTKETLKFMLVAREVYIAELEEKLKIDCTANIEILEKGIRASTLNFKPLSKSFSVNPEQQRTLGDYVGKHQQLLATTQAMVKDSDDVGDLIKKMSGAVDSFDPLTFNVMVMSGKDPRMNSLISMLIDKVKNSCIMEDRTTPTWQEWVEIQHCVMTYYYHESVDLATSQRSASDLMDRYQPKKKQIEHVEPIKPSPLEKIGVSMEQILKLEESESLALLGLLEKLEKVALDDKEKAGDE